MSPAEVARMKATLRFLREHRQILKLKVNAAEDLLLNGRREPTHRGVCQHLLSKLDRARVIAASERLPPAEATELLAGIVRVSPEVPYSLRFLQCVKASANRAEAAAALTQALERLDLRETSPAQLRDILLLIVEVFPAEQLPLFVLTLLDREEVEAAVERARESFPDALARLLLPLGALHASIGRAISLRTGAPTRAGPQRGGGSTRASDPARRKGGERLARESVEEGARLLLESGGISELAEPLRRRLLSIACDAVAHAPRDRRDVAAAESLVALFRSLSFRDPAARTAAAWRVVGALLAAGRDPLARRVLGEDLEGSADAERARRWVSLLAGQRIGRVALERPRERDQGRRNDRAPNGHAAGVASDAERWQRGFHLPTQREVLVRAALAPAEALFEHAAVRRRAALPGIAPIVDDVASSAAAPGELVVFAVFLAGPTLESRVERGANAELVVGWCREAVRLLHALELAGIELPDASARRFNVDASDRLWLTDLWGAVGRNGAAVSLCAGAPTRASAHVEHARAVSVRLLGALSTDITPAAVAARITAAVTAPELLDALALIAREP
jgi:hypothetical protein